jgi:formylglycine-generating enzyme required for sulfatase activity
MRRRLARKRAVAWFGAATTLLSIVVGCRRGATRPSENRPSSKDAIDVLARVIPAASASPPSTPPLATSSAPTTDLGPFGPTIANPSGPPGPPPRGMVWIPGGEFSMGASEPQTGNREGCGDPQADAQPVHRVYVDPFWMDSTEVTNDAYGEFVRATGYITVAERTPSAEEFPDAPPENLVAGSVVFNPPKHPVPLDSHLRWWTYIKGASWRHPAGAGSDLRGRGHYPVVQVAYEDAEAYAKWAHKRLPTEAEFEFAARGGLAGKRYAWGNEFRPDGRWMANVFQGHFPDRDTGDDGWSGIAPVGSFPPNAYGLYDIAGNVWEWVADWYRSDYYESFDSKRVARNPRGPADSHDPGEPGVAKRVQRGGSFLCSSEYCTRYLVGSRGKGEPSSGANHLGFRCVSSGNP